MNTVKTKVKLRVYAWAFALFTFANLQNAHAENWTLQSLMSELSKVKSVQSTFNEAKSMSMLNEPLQSSGTLSYKAPDFVEKRVLSPQTSYYIVSGDQVTIGTAQNQERQIVLFQYPALEAFIAALRATLAGDLKTLKEYYDVQFEGSRENWTMHLSPQDEEMQNFVKQIAMHGSGNRVKQVVTVEPNNDSSTMTISHNSD